MLCAMITRRFGKTGLAMPVFTCGGMRYQMSWSEAVPQQLDEANQRNLEATIHRSLEVGLRHIETARGYGTSEYQLGLVLRQLPRESFWIQSKVAPTADPREFLKNFAKSLELLQVDYLDLLGLHGINNREILENALRPGGCLDEALRLKREGRVRFVGFSTHGPPEVILAALRCGGFDYVNLHWYFIFQRNTPCLKEAANHDMGVFIISPSDKGGLLYKPTERLKALTAPLSPMAFNDLYCLQRPEIHTLSVGAARPGDFDEHLSVLPRLESGRDQVRAIAARLESELDAVMGRDFRLRHEEFLPPLESTPGGVNLRVIIWLWLLDKAFGMRDYAKMRYNLLGNGDHWFPGKKADPALLPDLARALGDHPWRGEIAGILREAHEKFSAEEQKRLTKSE